MTIHRFGSFRLDTDANIIFCGDEPLPLGQRAVALMRLLVERAGEPVAKSALIEAGASVRSSALVGSHATRYTVPPNGAAKA